MGAVSVVMEGDGMNFDYHAALYCDLCSCDVQMYSFRCLPVPTWSNVCRANLTEYHAFSVHLALFNMPTVNMLVNVLCFPSSYQETGGL